MVAARTPHKEQTPTTNPSKSTEWSTVSGFLTNSVVYITSYMLHVFILARSVHVDLLRSKGQDRAVQLVQGQCQGQDRAVRLVQVQAKIVQFKYKHQQWPSKLASLSQFTRYRRTAVQWPLSMDSRAGFMGHPRTDGMSMCFFPTVVCGRWCCTL